MLRARPTTARSSALAVPALGALAAEPLYVLVDTAIVGHLGTTQLAALAIAATVLDDRRSRSSTSSPTGRPRRSRGCTAPGASDEAARARRAGAVARRSRSASCCSCASSRSPRRASRADGRRGRGRRRRDAATCGSPRSARRSSCSPRAGQGFLRGIGDLRTPLVILVVAHVVNVVLELLFVYGFDWGLAGSAWGTVIAQAGMGARVRARCSARAGLGARRRSARIRPLMRIGGGDRRAHDRAARLVPRRLGRARARRRGVARPRTRSRSSCSSSSRSCSTRSRSPAQVIVGRMLGAGDAARRARRGAADDRLVGRRRRACSASCCSRSATSIPRAFTDDPAVIEQRARDLAAVRAR